MVKVIGVALVALMLCACDDPRGATKAAEDMGFTDVHAEGYAWFMCGRDYAWATNFTAKNAQGRDISGAVCSGLFVGNVVKLR